MASCTDGVRDLAFGQDAPGHQGLFEPSLRGVCPARTEQRPVGERPAQTHPVEHLLGALEILFTHQLVAEDKVRLVLDRQRGRIVALDLAGTVEILAPFLLLPAP